MTAKVNCDLNQLARTIHALYPRGYPNRLYVLNTNHCPSLNELATINSVEASGLSARKLKMGMGTVMSRRDLPVIFTKEIDC